MRVGSYTLRPEVRLILGPDDSLIGELTDASKRHAHGRLTVVVAWAREEGVIWLLDALGDRLSDIRMVTGVNERGTTVEAMLRLLPVTSELWVYFKHSRQTFHPKLYAFEGGLAGKTTISILVGSSNLTAGGLVSNFEASLGARADSADGDDARALVESVETTWQKFTNGDFAHRIASPFAVRDLYRSGHLVTEATIRRVRRRSGTSEPSASTLPTAPPRHQTAPARSTLVIPFDLDQEPAKEPVPPDTEDPKGVPPLPDRFFVRTLTANDIEKLHGRRSGTFEPDLGRTARDTYPGFWGWPDKYQEVIRKLPRREWEAAARLVSSVTPSGGIELTLMLWYREPREGHPEEHRLRFGPIGSVRSAVPQDFDGDSLVVFERTAAGSDHDFDIRFLTPADLGYLDFETYLKEHRAGHRFGYGPTPGV
jgi:HKD family nuclease